MQNDYAVSGHWSGEFNEAKLREWAKNLRNQLRAPRVSLGLVFMTSHYFEIAAQILEVLRLDAEVPLLIGCSSSSLVIDGREIEDEQGIVLSLMSLPGAELRGLHFNQEQVEEANGPAYWQLETGVDADRVNGWLVFADPFQLDAESWLRGWNEAYPAKPIQGGLASGDSSQRACQLYLDSQIFDSGGVAVAVGGNVELLSVISQGCTPIGETWTITKTEQNFIHQIGNRPAYEVLVETFNRLPSYEQQRTRGNLLIGLVVNEYLEDFHRGDFLVRNILGADPKTGSLAVGALPRQGQTLQFQRRDAAAATEDMNELLGRLSSRLTGRKIYGGCLCNCNGRGRHLFGQPDHDARLIQEKLGPFPVVGFFCNGEIGPIGSSNFLHGYTASLAVFASKTEPIST
jgi:small ligand-binding sensory domain FIST